MLIRLSKSIDLKLDIFAIQLWQGGNFLGTERDSSFTKFDTGYFSYELTPLDFSNKFMRRWAGWGAHKNRWSWADSGTQKIFNEEDGADEMPAGDYILRLKPLWMPTSMRYPELKQLRIGLSAPVPVSLEIIQSYEARNKLTERNSRGKAKLLASSKVCRVYDTA